MPLNELNRDAIAFKRLAGKAHTQQGFSFTEESITSNIQISYSTIFANNIEPLPETNSGLTSIGDTNGIVERVKFEIDIIPDTQIGTNQSQGYQLKLPAGYSGVLSSEYSGGTYLNSALGKLQIVPALYGTVKGDGSTEYDAILFQTDGTTQIAKFDAINWILDTYSGILFVQDPPSGYDVSASRPGFVEAFLYVGDYLDSFSGGTGGGTASGERIESDFVQSGNTFAIGDVVGWDNGLSQFRTVVSNETETINPEGIVSKTGDTFTITFAGYIEGISGVTDVNSNPLSGGTTYFLSETTAGKLTPDEPLTVGDISKPMISTFTVDDGVVYQYRGALITPAATGGTSFSGVTDGTNIGGGAEVFDQVTGSDMQFRTLVGSGGTSVIQSGDTIIISGDTGGDITTTLVTTTSDYAVGNSNQNLIASGTTGYTMPSSPTTGVEVTISDGLGTALTTPITIQGNGNNILDDTFALINTDYGSITFLFNGIFWIVKGFVP